MASMTGVISTEWASNQLADLLVFLPKVDMAAFKIAPLKCSHRSWALQWVGQGENPSTHEQIPPLFYDHVFCGVDARSALLSRTLQTLCAELHIAAHQRVVSVTIGALVAASYLDAGKVDTSGEDQV